MIFVINQNMNGKKGGVVVFGIFGTYILNKN